MDSPEAAKFNIDVNIAEGRKSFALNVRYSCLNYTVARTWDDFLMLEQTLSKISLAKDIKLNNTSLVNSLFKDIVEERKKDIQNYLNFLLSIKSQNHQEIIYKLIDFLNIHENINQLQEENLNGNVNKEPKKECLNKIEKLCGCTEKERLDLDLNNIMFGINYQEALSLRNFIRKTSVRDPVEAQEILLDTRRFIESLTLKIIENHGDNLQKSSSPSSEVSTLNEYIYLSVERAVFQSLYPQLMYLSISMTSNGDLCIITAIYELRLSDQIDQRLLGIPEKYRSKDNYCRSIALLNIIDDMNSPTEKLNIFKATIEQIHRDAIEYSGNIFEEGRISSLGAEDFLPILIYVVCQSNLKYPQTSCIIITNLASRKKLDGQMSYYITVLESALYYIANVKSILESDESNNTSISSDADTDSLESSDLSETSSLTTEMTSSTSSIISFKNSISQTINFTYPRYGEYIISIPECGMQPIFLSNIVVYHVKIQSVYSRYTTHVLKRFSEFTMFDRKLRDFILNCLPTPLDPSLVPILPPKFSRLFHDHLNVNFLEDRRQQLEKYIKDVMAINVLSNSSITKTFLRLEE